MSVGKIEDKLREENRQELMEKLDVGIKLKGKVKTITNYGAFVDLGGIDGLLHISDISWGKIGKVTDELSVGDEIEVMVLNCDKEKNKIALGLKQLKEDPWNSIDSFIKVGDILKGRGDGPTFGISQEIMDEILSLIQ